MLLEEQVTCYTTEYIHTYIRTHTEIYVHTHITYVCTYISTYLRIVRNLTGNSKFGGLAVTVETAKLNPLIFLPAMHNDVMHAKVLLAPPSPLYMSFTYS